MTYKPVENRYKRSPVWFRRCGRSGLLLPAISLGCWHNFGGPGTDPRKLPEAQFHENARQMLFTAFDHGITHFDLANNYGPPPGSAEQRVGRILREDFRGHRDELIISSKAGHRMIPGPYGEWGGRKHLIASCEASLKRLGLDYVDIFYSHRFDPHTLLEETLGALDSLVKQGKAIYVGISSYSGAKTEESLRICDRERFVKPIIHQPSYSMLNRGIEGDLLPVSGSEGLGVIGFCPLAQGLLTDKYLSHVPEDSRAKQPAGFLKEDRITPELVCKLNQLNEIARRRGQSLAQLALCWTLRDARVTSALIGASRPHQIIDNVRCLDAGPIDDATLQAVDEILKS
jgi:L-glyceraldehyde 3-phosphate reductase